MNWAQTMNIPQEFIVREIESAGSVAAFSERLLSKEALFRKACDILVASTSEEVREHFGDANVQTIVEWTMRIRKRSFHGPEEHFRAILSGLAAVTLREAGYPCESKSLAAALEELGEQIVHREWKITCENMAELATVLATRFHSTTIATDAEHGRDVYTKIGVTLSQVPLIENYKERAQAVLFVSALRRSDYNRKTILDHLRAKAETSFGMTMARAPLSNGHANGSYRCRFRQLQEAINTIRDRPSDKPWSKKQLDQLCKGGIFLCLHLPVEDLMLSADYVTFKMFEN